MQIYTRNHLNQFRNYYYIYYTYCVSNFFTHVSSEDYFCYRTTLSLLI